jgi:hypothetical protein
MNSYLKKKMDEEIRGKYEKYFIGCIARLKKKKLLSLYLNKKFDYSLGGYSHRERWSRTQ